MLAASAGVASYLGIFNPDMEDDSGLLPQVKTETQKRAEAVDAYTEQHSPVVPGTSAEVQYQEDRQKAAEADAKIKAATSGDTQQSAEERQAAMEAFLQSQGN